MKKEKINRKKLSLISDGAFDKFILTYTIKEEICTKVF